LGFVEVVEQYEDCFDVDLRRIPCGQSEPIASPIESKTPLGTFHKIHKRMKGKGSVG
jgi:hypothetical protein